MRLRLCAAACFIWNMMGKRICIPIEGAVGPAKEKENAPGKSPGRPWFAYERSAAGSGIAAAAVVAATAIAAAAPTAIATAAPNDDQQDDDPAAVAAAKTVIAHTGTSYENVDRPDRSQSIVCGCEVGVTEIICAVR